MMALQPGAFLIVQKGEPYQPGEALPLLPGVMLLGRATPDHSPHFCFASPYVSRRHALIEEQSGAYYLMDLPGSRHGVSVNGQPLAPGVPHEIRHRDRITLARDAVVLTFLAAAPEGVETWDYPPSQPEPPIAVNRERRTVYVHGQAREVTGKLFDLVDALELSQGRAISDHELKCRVWRERELGVDGVPLVTDEELTTLVYRLRKRLEPQGGLIRTVPGYGYMLDLSA